MPRRAKIRPDEPGREKVLAAALELFGERGYHATSIADIGLRAGISKSVLYHYFGSKAGLYEAIAEMEGSALLERVAAAVPADPDAPRPRQSGGAAAPRARGRLLRLPGRAPACVAAARPGPARRPRADRLARA